MSLSIPSNTSSIDLPPPASHHSGRDRTETIFWRSVAAIRWNSNCPFSRLKILAFYASQFFIFPTAIHHLYQTIILFTLPAHYEIRIRNLKESADVQSSIVGGVVFSADWWSAGFACTIVLPCVQFSTIELPAHVSLGFLAPCSRFSVWQIVRCRPSLSYSPFAARSKGLSSALRLTATSPPSPPNTTQEHGCRCVPHPAWPSTCG